MGHKRFIEFYYSFYDMWHINEVRTRVLYDTNCCSQSLTQLYAGAGIVIAKILWHLLHLLEIVTKAITNDIDVYITVYKRHIKLILLGEGIYKMFRRGEFMPVFLRHLMHLMEGLVNFLCIVYFHFVLILLVRMSV